MFLVTNNGVRMNKLKHANGNRPLTQEDKERMIEEAASYYGMYMTALGFGRKTLILQRHLSE